MVRATHIPTRTCRVCRRQAPKAELERWVIRDQELVLDNDKKLPGRGFYSCRSGCSNQIHQAVKKLTKSGK
ncbi:DUF448 domain-containing protein [bacterium]|nr:DUF448 domain-containing protein [bacterium]